MSKREFRSIKGSGDIYSKFGIEGLQERNKNNLLDVLGAVTDAAEAVADVHPSTFQAMGSMFRSMGSALRGVGGGIFGTISGQMMAPTMQLGRSIGFSMAGMMAPTNVAIQQIMATVTQPAREFTAQYQTGAGVGGLIGMIGGGLLGYKYGGAGMASVGASLGGLAGSYIGAQVERAIGGPTAEVLSAWERALINVVVQCHSYGWDSGQCFMYVTNQYWGHQDAKAAFVSLGWASNTAAKPTHATAGFLNWWNKMGFDGGNNGGGGGTDPIPIPTRTPRIGGAGGGGGHARKPRERRLM